MRVNVTTCAHFTIVSVHFLTSLSLLCLLPSPPVDELHIVKTRNRLSLCPQNSFYINAALTRLHLAKDKSLGDLDEESKRKEIITRTLHCGLLWGEEQRAARDEEAANVGEAVRLFVEVLLCTS